MTNIIIKIIIFNLLLSFLFTFQIFEDDFLFGYVYVATVGGGVDFLVASVLIMFKKYSYSKGFYASSGVLLLAGFICEKLTA